MKILHVVPTYLPAVRYGGPIFAVHGLCRALNRLGNEVHVYTTNVNGTEDSAVPLDRPVVMDGIQIRYFPSRFFRRLYWSPGMKEALLESISNFDLVHVHSVFLWPTWCAARIAKSAGIPYVVSPHGMLVIDLIRRKSTLLKSAWTRLIESRTISSATAIHVTTRKELDELRRFDLRLPDIWTVPNGVSGPGLSQLGKYDSYPNCEKFALFLGRMNWKKGLDRLIAAWKYVPETTLLVAGNDEDACQYDLEDLAKRSGVEGRIRFVGMVTGDRKWRLFRDAELFILPSLSENFGISVLEAMHMGCPVVVTPEVGLAETVAASKAGIVVEGEPKALGRAISELLADGERRKEMGENGRRIAFERYSWRQVADEMASYYRTVISSNA